MGKLILCSGERTTRPYGFASTGVRVYSMEELCYYLYHHVYYIDESMFTDSLIEWIRTELKLPERAEKLRQLKQNRADIKSMVTVILCSTDYYTEYEIKELLKILDEIIGMPLIKRNYMKANSFLKNGLYHEAADTYESILSSPEDTKLTSKEYGDILHNLAVAKVHTSGRKEAAELFREAYIRNQREESLCQHLLALKLSGNEEEYRDRILEYQVSQELLHNITDFMEQVQQEAVNNIELKELQTLKNYIHQGDKATFYQKAGELLEVWKAKARRG